MNKKNAAVRAFLASRLHVAEPSPVLALDSLLKEAGAVVCFGGWTGLGHPAPGVVVTEGEPVEEIAHPFRALEFRVFVGAAAPSPWTRLADEPGVLPNEFKAGRL